MQKEISISLIYYSLALNVFFWNIVSCSYQSEILTDTSVHVGHFPNQANPSSPPVNTHLRKPSELSDIRKYFESIIMTKMASEKRTHAQPSPGLPSSLSTVLSYGKTSAPEKKGQMTTTRNKTMPFSSLAKEAKNTLVLIKSLRYLTSGEKRKTVKPNLQEIKMLYDILSRSKTNSNGDKTYRYSKPVFERKETLRESTIKTTNGNKFMFTLADLAGIFRASNNPHNETEIRKKQNEKDFPSSNSTQQYSSVDLDFMKSFISLVDQITSKSKMTNTDVHSNIKRRKLNTDRITGRVDPELHHSIQQEKGMGTETSYRLGEPLEPKHVWKTSSVGTVYKAPRLMSNSDSKIKQGAFVLSSRESQKVHDILKLPKDNPEKFNHIQRTNRKDELKRYGKSHPMPNSFRKDSTYHRSSSFIDKSNVGNERHILKSEYFGHSPTVRLDERPSISDLNKYTSFSDVHRDVKPTINRFSPTRSNPSSRSDQERRNIVPIDKYNKHVNYKQLREVNPSPININMEHHKTRNPSLQGRQSLNQVHGLKRHQLTSGHKARSINSNSPTSDSQFFINQQSEQSGRMSYAVNNDLIPATPVHQSPNKIIHQDRSFYDINAERANVRDNAGTRLPTNLIPVKQQSRINYIEVSNNAPARNQELVASVRHGTESQRYKFSNGINSRRESIEASKDYNSVRNIRHQISNQETSPSLPLEQSPSQRPASQKSNGAIPHYTSGVNTHTAQVIPHTENMSINIKRHHVRYTNHPKHVESYRTNHNIPSGYLGGSQGKRSERLDLHQKSTQNSNVPIAHSSQLRPRNGYPVSANTEIQTYNRGQNGLNKDAGGQQYMYSKNHDSFLPREIQQINGHDMSTGIVKSNVHPYSSPNVNDNRYNDKGIQQASSGGMLDKHNRPESSRYTKQSRMVSIEQSPTENQHTIQTSSDANIFHVDAIRNGNHKATPRSDVYQPFNNVMRNQDRTIRTQAGYGVAHNTEIPTQHSSRQIIESHFYDPVTIQPLGPSGYSKGTNHQSQHFPSIRQQAVKYVQTKVVSHEAPGQNKELHKTILGTTGSIKNVPSSKYPTNSNYEYQNVNRQQHLGNSHSVNNLRTAHHQQQHHKRIDVANKLVSTIREPELISEKGTHVHHNSPLQKVAAPTQLVPSNHINNHERQTIRKSNKHHTPRQPRVIELVNKVTTRISVDHGGERTRQDPKRLTSYEKSKPRPQYDPSVVQHEPVSPGKIVHNQKYPRVETSDNLTSLRTELYSLLSRIDRLQKHGSPQNSKQAKQAAYQIQANVFQSPYKSRTFPPNQTRLNKKPYNKIRNTAIGKFQNTRNVNIEKTNIQRQSSGHILYMRQPENLPNLAERGFPRKVQNGVPVKFQNQASLGILQSQSTQSFQGGNLKNAHKNVKVLNVPLSSHPDKFPDPSVRIHVTAEAHSSIPKHSVRVSKQLMTANSTASKSYNPFTEHNMQINQQHAYPQDIISPKQQTSLQTTNNTSRYIVEKSKYKRDKATNLPKLGSRGVSPKTYQQKYSTPVQSNFHRKQGNQVPAAEIKLHIQPSSHDVRFEVSVQGRKQISKPDLQIVKDFQNVFNATKGSNTPHFLSSTRMPAK